MSIKAIVAIMPPPVTPLDIPGLTAWSDLEADLGLHFPVEFKDFIEIYGSGVINNFLWIFNPFSRNNNINLLHQMKVRLSAIEELKAMGEVFPYELFPSRDGLIPFAATDNGDVLFWKVVDSNNWPIVINEDRSPQCEEFDLTWVNFLMSLLGGKLQSNILPMSVFMETPRFKETPS